ncbi:hypothetical protein [Bartonella bilalgolemii]|uniref:Uncharacterized protein n=1 Tax=Bartonella bilalgolemii TaxID=2942911 RepID=A0ABT0P8W4_9HYPH|nr:hypothetical protein [Bartonella sp. G70]MCL6229826.1 hypothetical protein [Bartonella sp. G70]
MVSVDSFQVSPRIDGYQKHSSHKEQNFNEVLKGTVQVPSVHISSKNIIPSILYDTLSSFQEFSDNSDSKVQFTEILPSLIGSTHSLSLWDTLIEADASQFQDYDGVPSGRFQVYVPLVMDGNQLRDLVHSLAREGKLLGGPQALFTALERDTARIYNQSDIENLIGKSVNWKQGNMFGTMWDCRVIDEQLIQKFQQEGKQIFTGAIGSLRFSIIY